LIGLVAARRIVAPIADLVRGLEANRAGAAPPSWPTTIIREVAALRDAMTRLAVGPLDLPAVLPVHGPATGDALSPDVLPRSVDDGLWDWDLATDTLYCSPRWQAIVGVEHGDDVVRSSFWLDRIHPEDLPHFRAALAAHLRGLVDHLVCEMRLRTDSGAYRRTLCRGLALRREDGTAYRIAGSLASIQDWSTAGNSGPASTDPLTGLASREQFLERLASATRRKGRTPSQRLAVVLLDVDRFKNVNDSLGRAVGDDLLIAISRRIEPVIRDTDTLARLAGDEWAILIDDLELEDEASQIAERVRHALREPLHVGEHTLFVTVSIGIALFSDVAMVPDDLLRDAETAMYRAKELGRDRHAVFDASLHGRAVALLELESDLRFALERGELLVYYQPIVSAASLEVRGVEALVRWQHPERGLVPPSEFIGFAEDSGLILRLGEWVLRRAIEQMRAWQAAGIAPERLSVNISARQLHQEHLSDRIAQLLDRAGLDPSCLELELTEGVVAECAEANIQVFQRLRALGIRLAVDDFGTGYSSLAYLTRFPVSTVKIDRSFLVDIQLDPVNQAIVRAVTTLAHSIGMRVVVEGIETTSQLDLARSLGCDEVQGFLVSVPLPVDEATVWLATRRNHELRLRPSPTPDRRL
jgi:diguanylate cyclase (GGDEF)-like protein